MKKFATLAVIPLFAGFLWAQTEQTTTSTTRTTYNGTLVDAACQASHTEHHESSTTTNPETGATTTETTHSSSEQTTQCPVTETTTSFGLLSPQGQYVTFDEPSNTKIVEYVKRDKKWEKYMRKHEPMEVQVVGQPNGNTVVLDTIR